MKRMLIVKEHTIEGIDSNLMPFSNLFEIIDEQKVLKIRSQFVFWRQITKLPSLIECKRTTGCNGITYHTLLRKMDNMEEILDYLFTLQLLEGDY